MLRCGIDLIAVSRVQGALERHGERFERRVFTLDESAYCRRKALPWPHFAVRFAAKEALYKSLLPGTLPVLVWREIRVRRLPSGAPEFEFSGGTAVALSGWTFTLALTHERDMAMAMARRISAGSKVPRRTGGGAIFRRLRAACSGEFDIGIGDRTVDAGALELLGIVRASTSPPASTWRW